MWRAPHWRQVLSKTHPDFYYPLGGSGYTMSQETLRFFVQELLPSCENTTDHSPEDYFVARCLWPAGIRAEPYWDETGASLYNQGGVSFYRDDFLLSQSWQQSHEKMAHYHPSLPPFPITVSQAISKTSVSFHLVKTPALMRRYERLIYRRRRSEIDCAFAVSEPDQQS